MSKKKKIQLNKVLFNNRHCAIFMLIVFVVFAVMLDSFVVNAESYSYSSDVVSMGGNGSFVSAGNAVDVFNWVKNDNQQYPFLNGYTLRSYYTGSGDLYTSGNNSAGFPTITAYGDWIYSDSGERVFIVPTEIAAQNHTSSMAINGAYYVGTYSPSTASSQQWIKSYLFQSAGNVAMISYYDSNNNRSYLGMISDQPLYYQFTRSMAYFGQVTTVFCGLVDEQVNGYYFYGFDSYEEVWVANCPIYLASTDKASGFTTLDEFSFSGNNTQFNYLLTNNEVVDPLAPSGSNESEIEKVSKSNMIFTSSDRWSGDTLSGMYHTYNFNANSYMKEHGEQFQIVVKHWAVYRDNTMQVAQNFDFPDYTMKVDMLLAGSPTGVFTIPLDLHNMKDSNGVSIRQYLLNTIYTTTGTNQQYIDINSMGTENANGADGGNIVTGGSSGDYWVGSDGVKHYTNSPSNNKVILKSVYENVVEDFTIYGSIYVRTAPPDYNYETDSNDTHYNVKNGGFGIDKNGGANQLYPPEEGSGVITPTINTNPSGGGTDVSVSGGSISNILRDLATSTANAIIESGAIQNVVHGGSVESGAVVVNTGGGGFQISNQDWNEYGNLIESMGEDMRAVSSGDGYNGVFQMFANAYSVFPAKVWALITLGIGGSVTLALWKKGTQCH